MAPKAQKKRGGSRPGAGRPALSPTIKKVSPEIINAGILPLEMRLRVARDIWATAVDAAGKIIDLAKAKEAAEFAEPAMAYTSHRLATISHTGPNGGAIQVDHSHTVVDEIRSLMKEEEAHRATKH